MPSSRSSHRNGSYNLIGESIVNDWIVPDKVALYGVLKHWTRYHQALIAIFIALVAIPIFGWPGLISVGVYFSWLLLSQWIENRFSTTSGEESRKLFEQRISLMRHLAGLVIVIALAAVAKGLGYGSMADSYAWLLLLVPVLSASRSLDRYWARAITVIAVVITVMLSLSLFQPSPELSGTNVLMCGWWCWGLGRALANGFAIGFVGLIGYVIARSLGYGQHARARLANALNEIARVDDWNEVCGIIADLYAYQTGKVHAYLVSVDRHKAELHLVGASSETGRRLVESQLRYSMQIGITGWVARHKERCVLNNIDDDPENRFYRRDDLFPTVRSAMASPVFRVDREVKFVIDIEADWLDAFNELDQSLLQSIVGLVEVMYDRQNSLTAYQTLGELAHDTARTVIGGVQVLESVLERIGVVANRVLDSDLIGFYVVDAMTSDLQRFPTIGELLIDNLPLEDTIPNDFVHELLKSENVIVSLTADKDPRLLQRTDWHTKHKIVPFVLREKVISCAAVALRVANQTVGLMFISYRRFEDFPGETMHFISVIASLAASAIQSCQKAQLEEREEEAQRQQGWVADLHDATSISLSGAIEELSAMRELVEQDSQLAHYVERAHLSLMRAQVKIKRLATGDYRMTLEEIIEEIRGETSGWDNTPLFSVKVSPIIAQDNRPIRATVAKHILGILLEALGNAKKHAVAKHVGLRVREYDRGIEFRIIDSGLGFNVGVTSPIPGRGLSNMRFRIEDMSGSLPIFSRPGVGTCVRVKVPNEILFGNLERNRRGTFNHAQN